jgi:hypothetical protein
MNDIGQVVLGGLRGNSPILADVTRRRSNASKSPSLSFGMRSGLSRPRAADK